VDILEGGKSFNICGLYLQITGGLNLQWTSPVLPKDRALSRTQGREERKCTGSGASLDMCTRRWIYHYFSSDGYDPELELGMCICRIIIGLVRLRTGMGFESNV
jgi:hypothetical protein